MTTETGTSREVPVSGIGAGRRWGILGASATAQAASAVMVHGPVFLIPTLVGREGLSLAQAGLVAAAPMVGVMLALVGWGLLSDRRGERFVLLAGLGLTVLCGAAAALSGSLLLLSGSLVLAGAAAASTASASGRVVVGWFAPQRRGLAMGIRQMAQPAGVGLAAVTMAVVADRVDVYAALWVPTAASAAAAVLVALVVLDPPRPARGSAGTDNPYARDGFLLRVHAVSVLLVLPQFVVWTFALVWLVQDQGWSPAAAGSLVAAAQLGGALGRIAVGQLSDLVGARLRPLRWVALAAGALMLGLGAASGLDAALAVPLLVLATVVTVADNGLAFTAVAERAGPFWSGRALGAQNTAQYAAAAAVPPLAGLAIASVGYSATFALVAVFPLLAVALVPVAHERTLH